MRAPPIIATRAVFSVRMSCDAVESESIERTAAMQYIAKFCVGELRGTMTVDRVGRNSGGQ